MLHLQTGEELCTCRLWRLLFLLQLLQEKGWNDRRREAKSCKGNFELSLKLLDRQPALRILLNKTPRAILEQFTKSTQR
jgi:hypothetical protein